eukprot:CAMPEP_0167759128 /NCGR_PEP_ID=MMETSP0110_2-20121227/10848_1 /TAXON_ID=629695 /ORGANISM="Gymnochlora sp., Strain CCMP2014" /LENGTH=283 /DNA_ID=CAMNT_0007645473 /DNA_START=12 /DNA_END=860 /DNA_ORIENTATION=-
MVFQNLTAIVRPNMEVVVKTKGSSWLDNKKKGLEVTPLGVEDNWVDKLEHLVEDRSSLLRTLNSEDAIEFDKADIEDILRPRYDSADIPKIFVYELPDFMTETLELSNFINRLPIDYLSVNLTLSHTDQYGMDKFVADALSRRTQYLTKNPEEADLFYMPFKHNFYGRKNMDPEFVCIHRNNKTMFEHLNSNTACRHFHASGAVGLKCGGEIQFQRQTFGSSMNFMSLEFGFDVPYPNYAANSTEDDLRYLINFLSTTWTNRSYLAAAHFGLHGYKEAADLRW